jgi:putative FmdB family regulatory protein
MPIYVYRCEACEVEFEELVPSSTAPAPPCPSCGSGDPTRVYSSFGTKWRSPLVNWHRVGSSWGAKPPKKVF